MRKSIILSKFNPDLTQEELNSTEDLIKLNKRVSKQTKNVEGISKLIERKNNYLNQRIHDLDIKVNSTLFGDRKFLNESYAFEIPIKEEFFEPNSSIDFKDNILTTKTEMFKTDSRVDLNISNIKSRKNTKFKYIDRVLTLEENEYYSYQELEIVIPEYIVSGFFYIEFDTYHNISVLNKYGKEVTPKQVTNKIKHPIEFKNKSIVLRFNSNSKRSIRILDFFVTQESFNTSATVLTKPVAINRSVSQLGIFTCDNYSSTDISIDYQISINGSEYKDIRPLNKQKNLNLNSIISTDFVLKPYVLDKSIKGNNSEYFLIGDFDYKDFNLISSYRYKLKDNIGFINNFENTIYVNTKIERTIKIPKNKSITLNGKKEEGGLEGKEVVLKKGFNELLVPIEVWNQRHNLLEYTVLEVKNNSIKFKDKEGVINTIEIVGDSIFYQIYDLDIYTDRLDSKIEFINDRVFISKGEEEKAYVFIKDSKTLVNTVQLKISLKTLSQSIPPYISSLTIKAV